MPKMHIIRSKQINAPLDKVYQLISNMNEWKEWSPWLIMNPVAKVAVSDDAKHYSWEGKRVGTGEMKVLKENGKDKVDYDLTFLKPWKSTAKVSMKLDPTPSGTMVHWEMDSSLPWFMFWMKKSMEAFVGSDYDRGLNLLKDYAEDGKIHSQLNFIGEGNYPGCNYISITRSSSMAESAKVMQADFEKLAELAQQNKGLRLHEAFCQYHKWDFKSKSVKYTAAIPYDNELPTGLSAEMTSGKLPATKTYTLEHVGPYTHLGNAWSTLYNMHRGKEFKPVKNIHPFETYHNNPADTDPNELITRIHFAVK